MNIKTYDDTDLMESDKKGFSHEFIVDLPGDNPDTLGDYDCHKIAERLKETGAFSKGDLVAPEWCVFYVYFRSKTDGRAFVKKLNAYIIQKARLLREARAF